MFATQVSILRVAKIYKNVVICSLIIIIFKYHILFFQGSRKYARIIKARHLYHHFSVQYQCFEMISSFILKAIWRAANMPQLKKIEMEHNLFNIPFQPKSQVQVSAHLFLSKPHLGFDSYLYVNSDYLYLIFTSINPALTLSFSKQNLLRLFRVVLVEARQQ